MKCNLLHASLAALTLISAHAGVPVTLTWSAQESGGALCLSNGTALTASSVVRLGYFDLTPEQIRPLFTQPTVLDGHFTELARTNIGQFESQIFVGAPELSQTGISYAGADGCFASSVIFTPAVNAAEVDGKRCYFWVMNAATVAGSSQHGIFSDSAWILNSSGGGAVLWDVSQVSHQDAGDVLLGSRGPHVSTTLGGSVLRLANTSQLALDLADDDRDGVNGLLETAFAMSPEDSDSAKLPQVIMHENQPALEFTRKTGGVVTSDGAYTADGLRYVVEISSDLQGWETYVDANDHLLLVTPGTEVGSEKVCLALTPATLPEGFKFARIRVDRVN